jgi:hypothetical protein
MARIHVVRRRETLFGIAKSYGLRRWQCVYNRQINPGLVARRPNPNHIEPGDVLHIPETCEGTKLYGAASLAHP